MKTTSNKPFPKTPQQWKKDQWAVYINHKDNGPQDEENEGKRYEADFTVVDSLQEADIIQAFMRRFQDQELDQKVIDTIQVDGKDAILVKKNYPNEVPKINAVDVLTDDELLKDSDVISSEVIPVDSVLKKVSGKVKNYLIDCSAWVRTSDSDADVQQLMSDGNTIITEAL